jgi:nitroreductase/NAD-dependent dihydropyrimidine dehydrogenase PreA subunit
VLKGFIMLNFTVQNDLCTRCGLCALDCPTMIIDQEGDNFPTVAEEDEECCIQCQHCMAICPTGAISVFGLDPKNSLPVSAELWPKFDQMNHLIHGRRSIRHYRDENVDPKLIDRLLAAAANSPTGINNRLLRFTVIDDKAQMARLREKVMTELVRASRASRIPERYSYIQQAIDAYVEHQADVIFRGAPHALIVSTPPESPCPAEDVAIALSYFELLAQSAGLGTVWCGMIKLAFESVPELKKLVDLPPDHHYYAMLFGHPAIHYARGIQRDDAAEIRRVKIG